VIVGTADLRSRDTFIGMLVNGEPGSLVGTPILRVPGADMAYRAFNNTPLVMPARKCAPWFGWMGAKEP
jgi:hypothetical protein